MARQTPNDPSTLRPWLGLGIMAVAASALVDEIALTRIFSVLLWYHFAYLAISVALFGLGLGGLVAFLVERRLARPRPALLAWAAGVQAAAMVLGLLVLLNIKLSVGFSARGIASLVLIWVVGSLPFAMTGLIMALAFRWFASATSRIYFTDLLGSALGCVLFAGAISVLSGPGVVLLAAGIAAVGSGAFAVAERAWRGGRRRIGVAAVTVLLAASVVVIVSQASDLFSVKYTKNYVDREDRLFEKWSPLARITVYPGVFWKENARQPFGWGMSKSYEPPAPIDQLWVEQDGCAGTPITRFDGDFSKLEFLRHDVTALPYHLRDEADVFIVGAGGGRDVLTALAFDAHSVLACDINPIIVDLVKRRYREFAGNLYSLPRVRVEVAEARSFIRTLPALFDIIQISLIDTWASTSSGALSLSENSLYTVEAFTDYLEHLRPDGVLSVTRYLFMPRNQSLRVATVARAALERLGVTEPERHIIVVGNDRADGVATLLAKRRPFTAAEIERTRAAVTRLGFVPLYLAGSGDVDPAFRGALETRPLESFLAGTYFDLRPTTDDRPFFFQMTYFSRVLDLLKRHGDIKGQTFNFLAHLVLLALLIVALLMVALFYFLPLGLAAWRKRREVRRGRGTPGSSGQVPMLWGAYFILLGVGFMLVEIPLMQKGALYLGHPTYGLTVVLTSILVFAGLGSEVCGRLERDRVARCLPAHLVAVAVVIAMLTSVLDPLMAATIGRPFAARVLLVVGAAGVVAFPMGAAFPSGIRLVASIRPAAIPWAWALNGGASVLGSIVAMALAMNLGLRTTLGGAAVAYTLAALACGLALRSRQRATTIAASTPIASSAVNRYRALPQKITQ